jgi:anti-sigma B factor antagonist
MEGQNDFESADNSGFAAEPPHQTSGSAELAVVAIDGSAGASVPFTVRPERGVLVVGGEIDVATSPELMAVLETVVAQRDGDVVVDCSAVTFFGAAGVGALVAARNRLRGSRHRVIVRNPSPVVRRVLMIVDLADLFADVADTAAHSTRC